MHRRRPSHPLAGSTLHTEIRRAAVRLELPIDRLMAGLPCPVPGRHRRPPRCRLHRSRSKKFQSFSVSLGMKRLSRFYDFRPMAEPAASYEEQNSDVKIYRADITSRPTRGSEISADRRFGFPGLEAPLALFPLHVLIGSALSTIKGYAHVRAEKKKFFFVCLREGRRGCDAGLPASTLASPDVPSIGAGRKNFKVFSFP